MTFQDTNKGILAMERLTSIPHSHNYKYNGHSWGKNFWKCEICNRKVVSEKNPTRIPKQPPLDEALVKYFEETDKRK